MSADAYAESLRPGLTGFADWRRQLDADALAAELERARSRIDRRGRGNIDHDRSI
jgi:hypothetical protein